MRIVTPSRIAERPVRRPQTFVDDSGAHARHGVEFRRTARRPPSGADQLPRISVARCTAVRPFRGLGATQSQPRRAKILQLRLSLAHGETGADGQDRGFAGRRGVDLFIPTPAVVVEHLRVGRHLGRCTLGLASRVRPRVAGGALRRRGARPCPRPRMPSSTGLTGRADATATREEASFRPDPLARLRPHDTWGRSSPTHYAERSPAPPSLFSTRARKPICLTWM